MACFNNEKNIEYQNAAGHKGGKIIDEQHGAVNGFIMGISIYDAEEYGTPGVHEDQEGFYILEGKGKAKVGEEEFDISSGTAFVAPAGVKHIMKKDKDSGPLKVLWTHAAL